MKYLMLILILLLSSIVIATEDIRFPTKDSLSAGIIKAINSNDRIAYLNTFHPIFQSHLNTQNEEYFNSIFNGQLEKTIPDNAKITFSDKNLKALLKWLNGKMIFPVNPTTTLTIDYKKSEHSYKSMTITLTNDKFGWYQIQGVPTSEYLAKAKAVKLRKAQSQEKLRVHVESLDLEIYNHILNILKSEKSLIKAYKFHKEKTGTDKSFSIQAVKLIRKRENLEW